MFKSGSRAISVRLDDSGICTIPWEVTGPDSKDKMLFVGCCGTCGGETILPTIWASLGVIAEGAGCCADASRPPAPSLWEQELAKKGDTLGYTEHGELGLYAGDSLLSSVPVAGGGGGGASWGVGHGLKIVGGNLTVNAVDDFNGDNTLPMTAAGVQTTVGNIEALLGVI